MMGILALGAASTLAATVAAIGAGLLVLLLLGGTERRVDPRSLRLELDQWLRTGIAPHESPATPSKAGRRRLAEAARSRAARSPAGDERE